MLPPYYKIQVFNDQSSVACTIRVASTPFKISSGGILTYATTGDVISSGSVSSGTYATSSAIDNTSNLYTGLWLQVYVTPASTPNGNVQVIVYLLPSLDNSAFEDIQTVIGSGGKQYGNWIGNVFLSGTSIYHQAFRFM